MNNHILLLDIRRDGQAGQGGTEKRRNSVSMTLCL